MSVAIRDLVIAPRSAIGVGMLDRNLWFPLES